MNAPESGNTSPATDALNKAAETAHGLVDRAADPQAVTRAMATAQRLRDAAHSAVDHAINAATPAAQWIDEKTQRQQELADTTVDYVRSNPVKAVAIAFVAGLIVGRILL